MFSDPVRYILLTTPGTDESKPMGHIAMKGIVRGTLGSAAIMWTLAALALGAGSGAYAQTTVVATIESLQTSASAHPEVAVQLQSNGAAPTSAVLFIRFEPDFLLPDPDYYETIATDSVGNVERDANGNATVFRSAIKPSDALTAAGKAIVAQVYTEGVIGVAISGINETPIPAGNVFTIGFRTQPGISAVDSTFLEGIPAGSGISVTNPNTGATENAQSSAATLLNGVETSLPLIFNGGGATLLFSCPGNVPAVTNLAASTNDPDATVVSWNSPSAIQFRVYRSNTNNFATAKPLGSGWITANSFSDFSAAPGASAPGGCFGPGGSASSQFYWVIARDANKCESAATGPVSGSRAPAKAIAPASAATLTLGLLVMLALIAADKMRRTRTAR